MDRAYLDIVQRKGFSCRYRKLDEKYKRLYQDGGLLYRQMDSRADVNTSPVIEVKDILIRRAIYLLTISDVAKKEQEIRILDSLLLEKISQLPH